MKKYLILTVLSLGLPAFGQVTNFTLLSAAQCKAAVTNIPTATQEKIISWVKYNNGAVRKLPDYGTVTNVVNGTNVVTTNHTTLTVTEGLAAMLADEKVSRVIVDRCDRAMQDIDRRRGLTNNAADPDFQ